MPTHKSKTWAPKSAKIVEHLGLPRAIQWKVTELGDPTKKVSSPGPEPNIAWNNGFLQLRVNICTLVQ